jgi:hypothetical protein
VDVRRLSEYILSVNHLPRRVFRAMFRTQHGRPRCGPKANELGVRPVADIPVDEAGWVNPRTGGMSAAPDDPALLPPHVRPMTLRGGRGKLPVFSIERTSLPDALKVRPDPAHPERHLFVEPAHTMSLAGLQATLCGTRTHWQGGEA